MKKLLITVFLMSLGMTTFGFSAESEFHGFRASFNQLNIQSETSLARKNINAGGLIVDLDKGQMRLYVFRNSCQSGRICPRYIPRPEFFDVKIESVYSNRCGVTFYVGSTDYRMADGLLTQIYVADNSNSVCSSVNHSPDRQIRASLYISSENPKIEEKHYFIGTKDSPVYSN